MNKNKTAIKVWISPATKKAIEAAAARDYLPVSVYVNRLILQSLKK